MHLDLTCPTQTSRRNTTHLRVSHLSQWPLGASLGKRSWVQLGVHQAEVLQLVRSWRADDLGPQVAPDLMPETLRRVVKRIGIGWTERKCQRLSARPRLLVTWADPSPGVAHDGGLYLGAGAVPLGGRNKLLFAWPLDPTLRAPLRAYAERARA